LVMSAPDNSKRQVKVAIDEGEEKVIEVVANDLYALFKGDFGKHKLEMTVDTGWSTGYYVVSCHCLVYPGPPSRYPYARRQPMLSQLSSLSNVPGTSVSSLPAGRRHFFLRNLLKSLRSSEVSGLPPVVSPQQRYALSSGQVFDLQVHRNLLELYHQL